MLSDETWNALAKNGREKYAPLMGKTFKHETTGFVGVATNYTLSGQLWLLNNEEVRCFWATECQEVQA